MKNLYTLLILSLLISPTLSSAPKTNSALPDSLITIENTYLYCLSDPERAQQIMDELRKRNEEVVWQLDWCQGDLLFNTGKYRLAAWFFERTGNYEAVKNDRELWLGLLSTLTECYRMNNEEEKTMQSALCLLDAAKELKNDAEAGRAYLFIGKILFRRDSRKEADDYFERAEQHLQRSGNNAYLYHFYLTLANLLTEYGRHDEALRRAYQCAEALEQTDGTGQPEGYIAYEQGLLDALTADILAKSGKENEAASYYRRFIGSPCAEDNRSKIHIVPYLLTVRNYTEAIEISKEREKTLRAHTDTVGDDMLAAKRYLQEAYKKNGNLAEALSYAMQTAQLLDNLRRKEQMDTAVELATIHGVQEKEARLATQQIVLQRRNLSLICAITVVMLCLVIIFSIYRYLKQTRRKNRALVEQIRTMRAYREKLEKLENEKVDAHYDRNALPLPDERGRIDEKGVYEMLNMLMKTEKTYLNPNITREDVAAILDVNRQTFIKAVNKYSGGSFTDYINNKRMEYALHLLDRPVYEKLEVLAEQSGFGSVRSFYRLFKDKYGLSPLEYRKQMRQG